ncbi:hypothetical protein JCM10212_001995 [Sporobolomyces blumeae]
MSPHGAHKTPPRDLRRALTTPAAHPTPTTPTSTSTSLRDRFPTLTPAQHARLDRIISALPADARTWAEFKGKQEELERGEGPARRTSRAPVTEDNDDDDDDDEADDDADIFQASLQLVFQDGATWKDKWRGVQARIAQATGEGPARRLSGTGRTGDRLGIVRARMDQVQLEDDGRPSSSRRPGLQATPSSATRISPPRPHSTPVDLAASPMKGRRSNSTTRGPTHESTRSFLVRRPEPGYSSSDDYAGVPSLQDLVLARRRRRDQEQSEQPNQTTSPEEVRHDRTSKRRSTTAQPPVHHCADDTSPGSAIIPIESTPARPSKHPLLERRLAELGLDSPISRHLEDAELATPEPAIRRTSTRRDETSHALTATSGRGSAPSIRNAQALEAEADRFRRLRLISTHYDAWQSLLSFQTSRARSVKHARDTWLVRREAIHLRQLDNTATVHRARQLASSALAAWKHRHRQIVNLEQRSLDFRSTSTVRLVRTTLKTWSLSSVASRHYESQTATLAKSLLSTWVEKLDHLEIELEGRALSIAEVKNVQLQTVTFEAWLAATRHRKKLQAAAQAVSDQKSLSHALSKWKTRVKERILRERLETWKEQVIVRKELERESTILYESQLVQALYKRWVFRTVDVANSLARADNFRSIKAEELRDSTFHRWLSSTRRSMTLKQRLSTHAEQRRRSDLENAFGRWRERKLETPEKELEARLASKLRKRAFEKWSASTTRAVMHDSSTLISAVFERWSLKTSYRRAFRHTSTFLGVTVSPTSRHF